MSGGWVAGTVRARALAARRIGGERAWLLAGSSLAEALAALAGTRALDTSLAPLSLEEAERALQAGVVWRLRVLAGWLPPGGPAVLRALAALYEAENIERRLTFLLGGAGEAPTELGSLATDWSRLRRATSPAGLGAMLSMSRWGDPGSLDPGAVSVSLHMAWCVRIAEEVPGGAAWGAGLAAILVASAMASGAGLPTAAERGASRLLGTRWRQAASLGELAERLPRSASWSLSGLAGPDDLWRAGAGWWRRVERDGLAQLASTRPGPAAVAGAGAAMMADSWRVRAALELAARGGAGMADVLA